MSSAFIVGCGAHGRVVLDTMIAQKKWDSIAFIDDNQDLFGTTINSAKVVGDLSSIDAANAGIVVAIGHPEIREKLARRIEQANIPFINAIHPTAVIQPSAQIGVGNVFFAQSVINSNASIGNHVIINTAAVVEHDCVIHDFASISPGCQIGARVEVGKYTFFGTGAIVNLRVKIGSGSIIGAGSLVLHDIPDNVLAYGVPAKVIREIDTNAEFRRVL